MCFTLDAPMSTASPCSRFIRLWCEIQRSATSASVSPCAAAAAARKKFAWPIPKRHLPRTLRNATTGKSKKYAPYGLEDLEVGSWGGLARRLGRGKKGKKLRQRFKEFMYMGGGEA